VILLDLPSTIKLCNKVKWMVIKISEKLTESDEEILL